MSNLKTCFCHKCSKFMYHPYKSVVVDELYHKWCLPETIAEELEEEQNPNLMSLLKSYDVWYNRV